MRAKPFPHNNRLNHEGVSYESQDGLYDVAWSEVHENQLATASGDGSIRLWDIMLKVRNCYRCELHPQTILRICRLEYGKSILERFFPSTGQTSGKTSLHPRPGTVQ